MTHGTHAPEDRAAGLSPSARRLLDEAVKALSRGQPDAAERTLIGVMAMAPKSAEAHRLLGISSQMRGDPVKAADAFRQADTLRPDDPVILMSYGISLFECGKVQDAIGAFRRACELAPDMASAWYNLGKALKLQLHAEEACRVFERALSLDPSHVTARISLADTFVHLGDIAAGAAHYREVLKRQPEHAGAWYALANLKTEPFSEADTASLRRAFRKPGLSADARVSLGFALAKALEDQRLYSEAFEALREANTLKRRQVLWNAREENAKVDAIMSAFATSPPAPVDPALGREAILIISLPRSGSTLIEQILASHPQVEGANEILDLPQVIEGESRRRKQPFPQWVASATAEDWARLGREYLDRTARWRQQRPLFTDKNTVTWELVGAARAMLPGARIVNVHRDPLETCLACYRQLFSTGSHFSYDLDDMASYYLDFARLSRYWLQRYPGQVLDFSYEALLADPETQTRRLLDFCGLSFDPACLDFHKTSRVVLSTASAAQVRQPLRKDTARAMRYETQLAPLRARLTQDQQD
ncbi:sulfotransferase family protein [Dyella monticola]|uniref:Sulfotransferase family protein n=1 Tax=Dyella monticola TaxID=1927958 RepID=A0A370WT10_9GAMM|nr:tetratricopeptide repeat-containing sulfotransferase family protein [Dyella monticola]RDS79065.1 sulfotransferase family protein [Dyella monticola]